MPTTKRQVIRNYDRALQILRDGGGVLCHGIGKYSLTYKNSRGDIQTDTIAYAIGEKLGPHLKKRKTQRYGVSTDYVYCSPQRREDARIQKGASRGFCGSIPSSLRRSSRKKSPGWRRC